MKIGEYIELVKQADLPLGTTSIDTGVSSLLNNPLVTQYQVHGSLNTGNATTPTAPPPFEGKVGPSQPGAPPRVRKTSNNFVSSEESKRRTEASNAGLSQSKEPLKLDPAQTGAEPKYKPEYPIPRVDTKTGLLPRSKIAPVRSGRPDVSRGFGFKIDDIIESDPLIRPGEGRSTWRYITDFFNRQAWNDWLKYKKQEFRPKQLVGDNVNLIPRMLNDFNAHVKPVNFGAFHGLVGKAFPVLIPLNEAVNTVAQNATEDAYLDGVDVENNPDYKQFWKKYYLPELTKEVGRSSPNMLTEGISFVNPVAPLTITGELLNVIPRSLGYKGMNVPGFYHPHYQQNRSRSDREWEMAKNYEYINPDQLKQNSDRYGNQNYWIDNGAAYFDPVFQTAGWIADNARYYSPIHRMLGLHKGKPLYEHVMDNFGELIDRPTQYSVDEQGRKTVDWQGTIANSSWYDVNGGRPEFRNMSLEDRVAKIQPMINKAIQNGFTRDEIERAVELYVRNPGDPGSEGGSLLYTEANRLPMMAMSPAEIYGSMEFQNKVTNPEDIKGIPRTIKRFVPGYMGMGGTWYEDENPKWFETKKSLERRIADQKTLFKLYPFFEGLRDSPDQLTSEERDFINNPANLTKVQAMQAPAIYFPEPSMFSLTQEGTDNYEEQLNELNKVYVLNKLSRLPTQQRYAYFLESPEVLDSFLDRYYTNEDTKNKIRKFLFPDRATPEDVSVAKPVGTLTSILVPSLLKARQQARVQQQINDAK